MRFINAGSGRLLRDDEIIGIFNMDTSTVSGTTKDFLLSCQDEGRLIQLAYALPNSFILTVDDMVTLSPLSTSTLALRCRGSFEEGFDFRRKQICGDAGEDLPDEFEEDEETEEEENL